MTKNLEVKNVQRKEYDYPDPSDRIGRIGYGGCLIGILFILALLYFRPFVTSLYEFQILGTDLKNVEIPPTQPRQHLDIALGFLFEVFDYPQGKTGCVVVLKDRKRNVIWSVDCDEIRSNCKSVRLDRWIPLDSIRIKATLILDGGYEKEIMFVLDHNGKVKKIYGKS